MVSKTDTASAHGAYNQVRETDCTLSHTLYPKLVKPNPFSQPHANIVGKPLPLFPELEPVTPHLLPAVSLTPLSLPLVFKELSLPHSSA